MIQKFALLLVIVCAALISVKAIGFHKPLPVNEEDVIKKQFSVSEGQTLYLDSDLGVVRVRGTSDAKTVRVTITKKVRDADREEAARWFDRFDVRFSESSSGLQIEGRVDKSPSWFRRQKLQVEFDIEVPHRFSAEIKTAGGSITTQSLQGSARLKTAGGSITIQEIDGPADVHTDGGSITARDVTGKARLVTSGGSITLDQMGNDVECNTSGGSISANLVRGDLMAHTSGGSVRVGEVTGEVNATTSGGSISAVLPGQPAKPVFLETSGGSVTLEIQSDVRADIDANASGGRVHCDLPLTGTIKKQSIRGKLNGGGPLMTLRTSGGSVNVRGLN